jgi:hypothetical protein
MQSSHGAPPEAPEGRGRLGMDSKHSTPRVDRASTAPATVVSLAHHSPRLAGCRPSAVTSENGFRRTRATSAATGAGVVRIALRNQAGTRAAIGPPASCPASPARGPGAVAGAPVLRGGTWCRGAFSTVPVKDAGFAANRRRRAEQSCSARRRYATAQRSFLDPCDAALFAPPDAAAGPWM